MFNLDPELMTLLEQGRATLAAQRAKEQAEADAKARADLATQARIEAWVLEALAPHVPAAALQAAVIRYNDAQEYAYAVEFALPGLAPIRCEVQHWAEQSVDILERERVHRFRFNKDGGFVVPFEIAYGERPEHSFYHRRAVPTFAQALAMAEERERELCGALAQWEADEARREAIEEAKATYVAPLTPADKLEALYEYIAGIIADLHPAD
jgi:hypothetical protein